MSEWSHGNRWSAFHQTVTGLLPLSSQKKNVEKSLLEKAEDNPYRTEYWGLYGKDMPAIGWSSDFDKDLKDRNSLRKGYVKRGYSLYPWDIFQQLTDKQKKSSILSWNQGKRPSCSMHGASHAFQVAELYSIALGSQLIYESVNPIYSFYRARGGNYNGGLDLIDTAEEINTTGLFPVSSVGSDNISVTEDGLTKTDNARKHQAGIIRFTECSKTELIERIFTVCSGLGSICFGSGVFFRASKLDNNGVRVPIQIESGGHAQAFGGYKEVNGVPYVFLWNSHGDIYYGGDDDAPRNGVWCSEEHVSQLAGSMLNYGAPFVVIPEGEYNPPNLVPFNLKKRF